ncbi:MAG: hypothetical protein ACI9XO_001076 [Paraglaciecola sp.]|jgi:hypothetical protein
MKYLPFLMGSALFLALGLTSCETVENTETLSASSSLANKIKNNDFADYWYQGEAEVSSYHLEQARYGEIRNGDAVFVFVTEDFSKSKQVKLDNAAAAGDDKISILKLNTLRKFKTGIYDYSMMESVFTPVDIKNNPHTLKTTTSSQDWCGHSFTQFNLEEDKYKITEFSYFESEGDKTIKTEDALLEDELWTRLRINPGSIPEGNVALIPGTFFTRLKHSELKPKQATISIQKGEGVSILSVVYLHLQRSLTVRFESEFPFKILYFKENNGAGDVTQAVLKKSLKSAYWAKNSNRFAGLRDSLELTY